MKRLTLIKVKNVSFENYKIFYGLETHQINLNSRVHTHMHIHIHACTYIYTHTYTITLITSGR